MTTYKIKKVLDLLLKERNLELDDFCSIHIDMIRKGHPEIRLFSTNINVLKKIKPSIETYYLEGNKFEQEIIDNYYNNIKISICFGYIMEEK